MSIKRKGTPWIRLIIGGLFLSAAIGTVIFKTIITPGMPDIFLLLGFIYFLFGISFLWEAYKRMQESELQPTERPTIASGASVGKGHASGLKDYISDDDLLENYKKTKRYAAVCWIFAVLLAPLMWTEVFTGYPGPQSMFFAISFGLAIPFTFFTFQYKNDPEWLRAFLYKRKYKKDWSDPSQSTYQPGAKTDTRGSFCPYCAKSVRPDHRYCPHCSREL